MTKRHVNTFPSLAEMKEEVERQKLNRRSTELTLVIPDTLPEVHRALLKAAVEAMQEYTVAEDIDNLHLARTAIGVLYHYVLESQKLPNTSDDVGDILNHGRCVL